MGLTENKKTNKKKNTQQILALDIGVCPPQLPSLCVFLQSYFSIDPAQKCQSGFSRLLFFSPISAAVLIVSQVRWEVSWRNRNFRISQWWGRFKSRSFRRGNRWLGISTSPPSFFNFLQSTADHYWSEEWIMLSRVRRGTQKGPKRPKPACSRTSAEQPECLLSCLVQAGHSGCRLADGCSKGGSNQSHAGWAVWVSSIIISFLPYYIAFFHSVGTERQLSVAAWRAAKPKRQWL